MRKVLTLIPITLVVATWMHSGSTEPQRRGRGSSAGGVAAAGARLPTAEQWAANAKTSKYVAKANELAGTDPDLKFDLGIFCKASGDQEMKTEQRSAYPTASRALSLTLLRTRRFRSAGSCSSTTC